MAQVTRLRHARGSVVRYGVHARLRDAALDLVVGRVQLGGHRFQLCCVEQQLLVALHRVGYHLKGGDNLLQRRGKAGGRVGSGHNMRGLRSARVKTWQHVSHRPQRTRAARGVVAPLRTAARAHAGDTARAARATECAVRTPFALGRALRARVQPCRRAVSRSAAQEQTPTPLWRRRRKRTHDNERTNPQGASTVLTDVPK